MNDVQVVCYGHITYLFYEIIMEGHEKKYFKYCLVPLCKSTTIKTPNKIFIRLPVNQIRRKNWLEACGRYTEDVSPNSNALHVCEDHFNLEQDMENYMRFKLMGGNKKIKASVVPHKFDCQVSPSRKRTFPQPISIKIVKRQLVQQAVASTCTATESSIQEVTRPTSTTEDQPNYGNQKNKVAIQMPKQILPEKRCNGVQCKVYTGVSVNLSQHCELQNNVANIPAFKGIPVMPSLVWTKSTSRKSLTGSTSESTENQNLSDSDFSLWHEDLQNESEDFQTLALKCTIVNIEKRPRIYLGLPEYAFHTIHLLQKYSKLSNVDIFLTLKKIRTGHSFILLGDDFGISENYSSRIFAKSLPIISKYLRKLIISPHTDGVKLNMPLAFQGRYGNVFCIIDCLELEIEKPSDSFKQSLTWSGYKKCNTMKYLISYTSDEIINFISTGFGGHASDAIIVENSGFMNILPPNVSIIARRGFKNIEHLLVDKNCKLIRPPSLSSTVKVPVERVIQKIREFAFLASHACINNKLISHTDHIIKIVCGLINLQSGLEVS